MSWRRNLLLNLGDGAFFSAGMAFIAPTAILPLFVSHYTRAPWVLGLVSALYFLGLNLTQPLGAARLSRYGDFERAFRLLFLLPRLALLGMAITPWLPKPWILPGFFLCFGLFSLILGYQTPIWYALVDQFVPPQKRGLFFCWRAALGGVLGLLAAFASSWLLKVFPDPQSYGLCFVCAFVCISVSYLCIIQTKHPWIVPPNVPFREAARSLVQENAEYQGYLVGRTLVAAGTMAMAFYVVQAKDQFGLSAAQSSLLAIALTYLPALFGVAWGPLADRLSAKPIQAMGALTAALATVLLLLVPTLPVTVLCLFLIGCGQVSITQLDAKRLLDMDPRKDAAISLFNLFLMPSMALLPLAAGWLIGLYGIRLVLGLTAVAWLFGGVSLVSASLKPQPA